MNIDCYPELCRYLRIQGPSTSRLWIFGSTLEHYYIKEVDYRLL